MTSAEEHALLEEETSTLLEAKEQINRLQTLVNRGATATAVFDEQQRKLDTAQAKLRSIESRLRDRLIKAPFSGPDCTLPRYGSGPS